jgi:hypothetical protein
MSRSLKRNTTSSSLTCKRTQVETEHYFLIADLEGLKKMLKNLDYDHDKFYRRIPM